MNIWCRKKFLFFIFSAFTSLMILLVCKIEFSSAAQSRYQVYSVEFDWFGMNSSKLEEVILIPFEQKLSALEGLLEFNSSAQYSKTVTTLYFPKDSDQKNNYLALKDIVDSMYRTLPADVQKPQIYSAQGDSKSTVCIAFFCDWGLDNLRESLEKTLKKELDSIDGVGQVVVSGGRVKEVLVAFDSQKSAAALHNPSSFAGVIQDENVVVGGSRIRSDYQDRGIQFDTTLESLNQIKALPVKIESSITSLGYLADIKMSERTEGELVRIDGKSCVTVSIKKSTLANEIKLSSAIRRVLDLYAREVPECDYKILYDNGQEQFKLLKKVLLALAESFVFVILIIPLFYQDKKTVFLITALLFFTCLWTCGILSLLGFNLNQYTIAGLSIALGLIADRALLVSETAEQCESGDEFFVRIKKCIPSLVSAGLTTVLCLVVLFFLEDIVAGVRQIALTVLLMILTSLVLTVIFYPAWCYGGAVKKDEKKNLYKKIEFNLLRLKIVKPEYHGRLKRLLYCVLGLIPAVVFVFSGKNLNFSGSSDIMYLSVDYDSDVLAEYVDKEVSRLCLEIDRCGFVRFIRSESSRGNCQIELGLKSGVDRQKCAQKIRSLDYLVSDGYLHVPVQSKNNPLNIQVCVTGDENSKCREYAKLLSRKVVQSALRGNVVLNFKDDVEEYLFVPDRSALIKNRIAAGDLAGSLRWYMFGPVADKWLWDGKEYDIRLRAKNFEKPALFQVMNLDIPSEKSFVRLTALGSIRKEKSDTKIFTQNSRRAAYFSVEVDGLSLDRALKKLDSVLHAQKLEKGYAFSFNRELETMGQKYSLVLKMLLLCCVLIFLLLLCLTESAGRSLRIISIIPVSLALPCLFKFVSGQAFTLGDIVAAIILSGIAVNNSIYIEESCESEFELKLKSKLKSILVTSLTSVCGAVPLYILSEEGFNKDMALFMVLGILNSLFVTLFLYGREKNWRKSK